MDMHISMIYENKVADPMVVLCIIPNFQPKIDPTTQRELVIP